MRGSTMRRHEDTPPAPQPSPDSTAQQHHRGEATMLQLGYRNSKEEGTQKGEEGGGGKGGGFHVAKGIPLETK